MNGSAIWKSTLVCAQASLVRTRRHQSPGARDQGIAPGQRNSQSTLEPVGRDPLLDATTVNDVWVSQQATYRGRGSHCLGPDVGDELEELIDKKRIALASTLKIIPTRSDVVLYALEQYLGNSLLDTDADRRTTEGKKSTKKFAK